MPIYEYRCASCGKVFARLQPMTSPANPPSCPTCGSEETERVLSTFAAGSSSAAKPGGGGAPSCGASGGG